MRAGFIVAGLLAGFDQNDDSGYEIIADPCGPAEAKAIWSEAVRSGGTVAGTDKTYTRIGYGALSGRKPFKWRKVARLGRVDLSDDIPDEPDED